MSYRSIVLNLDEYEIVTSLVRAAQAIGEETRTHLIGVHCIPLSTPPASVLPYMPPDIYRDLELRHAEMSKKIQEAFELATRSVTMPFEWHLHHGKTYSGSSELIDHALTADLVVTSQKSSETSPWLQRELLQKSATPLLVVPMIKTENIRLGKITIAWNGTAQTTRAIRDSMPLLESADLVRILCVGRESKIHEGSIAGSDVATWLGHHSVSVTLDEHTEKRLTTGIAVLDDVVEQGADMLVIGGYGHSPLYDSLVGGWTDDVLANAELPVFVSH